MNMDIQFFFCLLLCMNVASTSISQNQDDNSILPKDLSVGFATASYQVEGGWNVSDKGENVWDNFTHIHPSRIFDGSNGDIACDSYHKYKEDIKLLKNIGATHYRFSISWSRLLPNGFANIVSKDGVRYYNDLLDELRAHNIEPYVTIYHWDHPQVIERMGGWTNELMSEWFADFARVVFKEFGSKVNIFITINEPSSFCFDGYGSLKQAPAMDSPGIADYLCGHNVLKAHARAYHIYHEEFNYKGKIGMAIPCRFHYNKYSNDTSAAEIAFQYDCGWMAHPIFSKTGDYPEVMKDRIAENSKLAGYPTSRLPTFSKEWINYIKGTADYFGLNHYTSDYVESVPRAEKSPWFEDKGYIQYFDEKWPTSNSSWLRMMPQGFGDVIRKIKDEYNNPEVYIMENGVSDFGKSLYDKQRLEYLYSYMLEMLKAIHQNGCNVKAYTIWSLLDNFEWDRGFSERFGVVHVDYRTDNRTRTQKKSAKWIKDVIAHRKLLHVGNY